MSVVTPKHTPDISLVPIASEVEIHSSRLSLAPSANRHLVNALLAADLALETPASDALIATYTPTAIPTILASLMGKGRRYWIYADYDEMFSTRPVERRMIRTLPRYFHSVMTYSTAGSEELAQIAGITARVVRPGLPREQFFHPGTADRSGGPVLLYVGDARPRKGLTDFLRAAELVQERKHGIRLRIVTKEHMQIRTSVPFEHHVAPDDSALAVLYQTSSIFVSSAWFEGLGLPPLEAMACGVPVVLTDQRGCRDYAVDGDTCLKVPIQRSDLIAEAVVRLLTDYALAARLVDGGRRAAAKYQWSVAVDNLEAILYQRGPASAVSAPEPG